ncbi:MAG TPA: pilus assembly protein TadG-related protein [Aliidongia sp.]|nr:pilus assembly protein TadG-related protein [Aliidongia sp.]
MAIPSFLRRVKNLLRTFGRSRTGNVGIIFGFAAIPLILSVGMGVDMARAYAMKVRLGAALDAAGLAVGGSPASFQTADLEQRMQNYFNANYPSSVLGTASTPVMTYQSSTNTNVINFTVTGTIQTTFMRLINVKTMSVSVSNQVTRGISGLEVALVLDNTGSMMCGDGGSANASQCEQNVPPSHMDTLRTDAQIIINTLFQGTTAQSTLKMSLVPYVTAVNVGPAMSQSGLLDTYVPKKNGAYFSYSTPTKTGTKIVDAGGVNSITYDASQSPTSLEWIGCVVEATVPNEDSSNTGPDMDEVPGQGWANTYTPYYWVSGTGPTYNGSGTSSTSNIWHPSTTTTTHSGTTTTFLPPKAQYEEVDNGRYFESSNSASADSYGPNLGCPTPLVRLTTDRNALLTAAQNMKSRANSGTAINVGLVWGWRTLSPNQPFSDGQPYINPKGIKKAIVLETDGNDDANSSPDYTGYGYIDDGLLGSSSLNTAMSNMQSRLLKLCANIQAQGIQIYTIGLGNSANLSLLKNCAGPGPDQFFSAPTAASLQSVFQQVANSLNQLRLSK